MMFQEIEEYVDLKYPIYRAEHIDNGSRDLIDDVICTIDYLVNCCALNVICMVSFSPNVMVNRVHIKSFTS